MTSDPRPFKLLFLCTGNSARSILGEYILRKIAPRRFETYSAGADPTGTVNPYARRVLEEIYKMDTSEARSKSWDELEDVEFDFVITVCDNARETCPVWPGQPILAHWGMEDPAAAEGSDEEKLQVFRHTALDLHRRLELLAALPFERLDKLRIQELTQEMADR